MKKTNRIVKATVAALLGCSAIAMGSISASANTEQDAKLTDITCYCELAKNADEKYLTPEELREKAMEKKFFSDQIDECMDIVKNLENERTNLAEHISELVHSIDDCRYEIWKPIANCKEYWEDLLHSYEGELTEARISLEYCDERLTDANYAIASARANCNAATEAIDDGVHILMMRGEDADVIDWDFVEQYSVSNYHKLLNLIDETNAKLNTLEDAQEIDRAYTELENAISESDDILAVLTAHGFDASFMAF